MEGKYKGHTDVEDETPEEQANPDKETSSQMLKSGETIKPEVDDEWVKALAERLYGVSVQEMKELVAYDDKNYRILEDPNMKNPLITSHCKEGYVLKITNSLDSKKLGFVEAQTEAMIYLGRHSVKCPTPIRNVYGHYFSVELLPSGKSHVVRLLEYREGSMLADIPCSDFLFYQAGEFIANVDRLLKNFSHTGCMDHKHIWMLESVPQLEDFKFAVKEPELTQIVDRVLEEFKTEVLPVMKHLETGVIHGDFNEKNMLVNLNKASGKENDWRITTLLDFGDMHVAPYLFELAIAMAYSMIQSGELRTGGLVLAGYSTIQHITDDEIALLRTCVLARLCQSLVMGAYSHQQDPNNHYVISNRKDALQILQLMWAEPSEALTELWKTTANDYLTRSSR